MDILNQTPEVHLRKSNTYQPWPYQKTITHPISLSYAHISWFTWSPQNQQHAQYASYIAKTLQTTSASNFVPFSKVITSHFQKHFEFHRQPNSLILHTISPLPKFLNITEVVEMQKMAFTNTKVTCQKISWIRKHSIIFNNNSST